MLAFMLWLLSPLACADSFQADPRLYGDLFAADSERTPPGEIQAKLAADFLVNQPQEEGSLIVAEADEQGKPIKGTEILAKKVKRKPDDPVYIQILGIHSGELRDGLRGMIELDHRRWSWGLTVDWGSTANSGSETWEEKPPGEAKYDGDIRIVNIPSKGVGFGVFYAPLNFRGNGSVDTSFYLYGRKYLFYGPYNFPLKDDPSFLRDGVDNSTASVGTGFRFRAGTKSMRFAVNYEIGYKFNEYGDMNDPEIRGSEKGFVLGASIGMGFRVR
ncbi:MAG TPA: hypothetical protein VM598_14680 [Bdellovibrionota bacterium]|nr:hypothetical protein [Bdellovibrionota bacterium]